MSRLFPNYFPTCADLTMLNRRERRAIAEGADWDTIVTNNDALFDRVFDFVEFGEFFDL